MAMVVVLSVMSGFGEAIQDRLLSVDPHLVVKVKPEVLGESRTLLKETAPADATVDEYEVQDVILRTVDGLFGGAIAKGLTSESLKRLLFETRRTEKKQAKEKFEDVEFIPPSAGEIYIGTDLARSLGVFEGDELTLISPEVLLLPPGETPIYERLKVSKVVRTNVPDIDTKMVYYDLDKSMRRMRDSIGLERGFELRLSKFNEVEKLSKVLKSKGLNVETWKERNSALFYSLKMEKILMGVFLALILFIASFSIVIVLVLLSVQKRRDLGLLMAMGLSPRRTTVLFTKVGMILSGSGMFLGLLFGLVICWIGQNATFLKLPDIYYDTRLPISVEPGIIGFVAILCILISFFSSWLPASMSAKVLPSQSLR